MIMLTKQAATGWRPVLTDMLRSKYTEEELRRELTPVGRLGRPEDIAKLAVFLASDDSSYTTGAVFDTDGRLSGSTYWLLHELLRM